MKKIVNIYLIIAISILLSACSESDYELEKSVFRPDPVYPSLPEYSEWGYNTFGTYYDRQLFIYNDDKVPAKMINTGGITRFMLTGNMDGVDHYDYEDYKKSYYPYGDMSMTFELPGFLPETYEDLVQLNDTLIDLTGTGMQVVTVINKDTVEMELIKGELEFTKAQFLLVDQQPIHVILSGYFGYQAVVDGIPISVSHGRFDVGVGEANFFRY
ncbi:MAG: hypothetical protein JXA72_07075 [Bacteroidales bacterium]|nr:hypothetical protein [Bacteroidales bacterium]